MSLLRRYQSSAGSAPQGLEDRVDYEEDRNAACLMRISKSKPESLSLRRPSPMPISPRSSFSSPSTSPHAPFRRTSSNWTPEDTIVEVAEEISEPSAGWAGKVDSAVHNVPTEHDLSYKAGAFVPQHSVAGQKFNYRLRSAPGGAVVADPAVASQ